ncbi:hypothetical protein [Novosphingobium sp. TH158]|uniref:hypothetical protein n=1 Tax=Novosphingobium sp. TH158 TaxID=2067455 RepID=UPI000C7B6DA6|nr:hypothetical protein [Novosphingobium sp. TH158]PLK27078.1 hypothetical protein C0V78_09430 [Novosphingobium sp. TH158]
MTSPAPSDPVALMRREMRVRLGEVGEWLGDLRIEPGTWNLRGEEFLLRMPSIGFRYRRGEGVTIERRPGARLSEERLFLFGTVYAAVACINGLYPIHASAVAWDGGVHAFAGPSGAGKSTLVTALGTRGFPMFCDDTLILDLSDPDRPLALPGHKRLKLTAEALRLTGARPQEQVDAAVEKFYAVPPGGDCAEPLPLRQLIFLEDGADLAGSPITGGEKIARLTDDHYTFEIYDLANRPDPARRFALQARLARQVAMARLVRPRDAARFAQSVELAAKLVCSHSLPT